MWDGILDLLTTATAGNATWLLIVFLLAAVGELGLPATCPLLEALLIFSGFKLAQQLHAPPIPFLALLLAGRTLGALSMYSVSRHLGDPMVERFGKYLRLTRPRLDRMVTRLGSFAIPSIVLARFTPGLTIATSVACGVSRIPRRSFFPAILLHVLLWQGVFLTFGAMGGRVSRLYGLEPTGETVVWIVAVLIALIAAGYAVIRRSRRKQRVGASDQ
ncbi:MAG: DedA family protein [Chloroflexota bacterium]